MRYLLTTLSAFAGILMAAEPALYFRALGIPRHDSPKAERVWKARRLQAVVGEQLVDAESGSAEMLATLFDPARQRTAQPPANESAFYYMAGGNKTFSKADPDSGMFAGTDYATRHTDTVLSTGGNDSFLRYPINGAFSGDACTIALLVRGRGWDAAGGARETLLALAGENGPLSLYTDGDGHLCIGLGETTIRSEPMPSLADLHTIVAVLEDGVAVLYLDAIPVARGPIGAVGNVNHLVLGQQGDGPGENKDILTARVYEPLDQPLVSKWHLDRALQPPARMTLLKTTRRITLDGFLTPEEWQDAVRLTGLVRTYHADGWAGEMMPSLGVASPASVFYVTYDDEYLYVGHHSPPPEKIASSRELVVVMNKVTSSKHDDSLDFDDHLRISLRDRYPDGANHETDKKIIINGSGATYEFHPLSWDPEIERGLRLVEDGWWVEMAIPWKDLHLGEPADGREFWMNLRRGWRQEMTENHVWTCGLYPESPSYNSALYHGTPAGEVRLQGERGVLVRLDEVGNLNRGDARIVATIANRTERPRTLRVELDSNTGAVREDRELVLAPNAAESVALSGQITNFATHTVTFRVADAASGAEFFTQGWKVRRRYQPEVWVKKYRSKEMMALENNFEFLAEYRLADLAAELTITHRESGREMHRQALELTSFSPRHEISTRDWPLGVYDIAYTFRIGDNTVGSASAEYERVPLPPWWQNDLGNWDRQQDAVPYPWTNMTHSGDTVSCWGRRFDYADSLLPAQILTQGRKLLRAPMTIVAETAGGETLDSDVTAVTKKSWPETANVRVAGSRRVAGESLALANEMYTDYDGFTWCRITLEPLGGGPVTIRSMLLDIPLTPEFTDVMNHMDYDWRNTGSIKPYEGPATPLWLGGPVGGIQWMCETEGAFFVKDPATMLRVDPGTGDGGRLRVVLVDEPTEFTEPHAVEFGFMVTPVRPKLRRTPLDPGHWGIRQVGGSGGDWFGDKRCPYMPAYTYEFNSIGGYRPNEKRDQAWQSYLGGVRLYAGTSTFHTACDDAVHFGDEWLETDSVRIKWQEGRAGLTAAAQTSRSYRDYYVWRHWNHMVNKKPIQGIYYDGSGARKSKNPWADAGYQRHDGTRAFSYGILGGRDICRRVYNTVIRWYPFGGLGHHNSGMWNSAIIGFGTLLVNGENMSSVVPAGKHSLKGVVTPALYRAEIMQYNFSGNPTVMLPRGPGEMTEVMGGADRAVDHIHGLDLLHDVPLSTAWHWQPDRHLYLKACERASNVVQQLALDTAWYRFLPYWEQQAVDPLHDEFYASFYLLDNARLEHLRDGAVWGDLTGLEPDELARRQRGYRKVVCIFYNHSDDATSPIRVPIDWQVLGFDGPAGVSAENAVHRTGFRVETVTGDDGQEQTQGVLFDNPAEFVRIEGHALVFPMQPWSYRMIVLEDRP